MEGFLARLGGIHRTVHGDGQRHLARIVTTCEEMLVDRECTSVTRADLARAVATGSPILVGRRRDGHEIHIFLSEEDKIGIKAARAILDAAGDSDVILVSLEGPTPFTRRACEATRLQFMLARDLCFNVTRHALVPRHERMAEPPSGVTRAQLPKLLDCDPVVQYYNWPVGTVVRVWRTYAGHEPVPYFRCVAPAAS